MPLIDFTSEEIEILRDALGYRKKHQSEGSAPPELKRRNEEDTDRILSKLREAKK